MPGKKMKSVKKPAAYEAMRKKGMPKSTAAKMANAKKGRK